MADASFDVVSKVDMAEVTNAVNQAQKEIEQRFDLKGTGCEITLEKETIALKAADEISKSGRSATVIDAYSMPLNTKKILDVAARSRHAHQSAFEEREHQRAILTPCAAAPIPSGAVEHAFAAGQFRRHGLRLAAAEVDFHQSLPHEKHQPLAVGRKERRPLIAHALGSGNRRGLEGAERAPVQSEHPVGCRRPEDQRAAVG